jgi:hypothetical protein
MYKNWGDRRQVVTRDLFVIAMLLFTFGISARAQQTGIRGNAPALLNGTSAPSGGALVLHGNSSQIEMTSTEWQFNRDYKFQNNEASPLTIDDLSLLTGDNGIQIMSPSQSSLPITIAPGSYISVRLGYSKQHDGDGIDTLKFITKDTKSISFPIVVSHLVMTPEQNGLGHRQIALSVTPDNKKRTVQVILYSGYQGNIAIYTKDGKLVDEAKNVKSYIWRPTPGKKQYDDNEYVVRVTCIDGGQTLTRSETVSFASK